MDIEKNDKNITIEELKNLVKEFCEVRDWDKYHNPKDLAIGIVTEAAELLELLRFKSHEEIERLLMSEKKRKFIEEELADVLYFVLRFAQKFDIDLSESLRRKLEINERKYPIDKVRGSNVKYNEEV